MQDEHHKHVKKQEMKVFTMYEGRDAEKEKEGRSTLVGKSMLAGMEEAAEFHKITLDNYSTYDDGNTEAAYRVEWYGEDPYIINFVLSPNNHYDDASSVSKE